IAPVEVARASPETVVCFHGRRLLRVVFAGPLEGNGRLRRDGRLCAVHRVLDAGLLLGLEQRMIVERIVVLVTIERQLVIEFRVPFLEREMILNHFREKRRRVYRHCPPSCDFGAVPPDERPMIASSRDESTTWPVAQPAGCTIPRVARITRILTRRAGVFGLALRAWAAGGGFPPNLGGRSLSRRGSTGRRTRSTRSA